MVLRLCVPLSHSLSARNWNFAACGAALTASRVANRVAVSTPLRADSVTVPVMGFLLGCGAARDGAGLWDAGRRQAGAGSRRPGTGAAAVRVAASASMAALSRFVALLLIAGQGDAFFGGAAQCLVERDGQQFGVAVGVAEAVAGDRVAVVAGVADQRPAGAVRCADHVGAAQHPGDR